MPCGSSPETTIFSSSPTSTGPSSTVTSTPFPRPDDGSKASRVEASRGPSASTPPASRTFSPTGGSPSNKTFPQPRPETSTSSRWAAASGARRSTTSSPHEPPFATLTPSQRLDLAGSGSSAPRAHYQVSTEAGQLHRGTRSEPAIGACGRRNAAGYDG